jgi:hypothetical protein
MTRATSAKRSRTPHPRARSVASGSAPTREDAEKLLAKARAEIRQMMRHELEAERVSDDLMNFRMKTVQ